MGTKSKIEWTGDTWNPVTGYEGLYEVCTNGTVRSVDRTISKSNKRNTYTATFVGRVLKSHRLGKGYRTVSLSRNGIVRRYLVHRLVASAFLPNPNNLAQVNHIDGNKSNNNVENLEWASRLQNMNHARVTGLLPSRAGEKNGHAKLTRAKARRIRIEHSHFGVPRHELARRYGVSKTCIQNILVDQSWNDNSIKNMEKAK